MIDNLDIFKWAIERTYRAKATWEVLGTPQAANNLLYAEANLGRLVLKQIDKIAEDREKNEGDALMRQYLKSGLDSYISFKDYKANIDRLNKSMKGATTLRACDCGGTAKVHSYTTLAGMQKKYYVICDKCASHTDAYPSVIEVAMAWDDARTSGVNMNDGQVTK